MGRDVKVTAIMTAPRHEIVFARNLIEKALRPTGIPLVISGGVFYGQCMQIMLQDAIKQGTEYALTVDFDSVFTTAHVNRLLNIIANDERDMGAIAAMQPKRGSGMVLASRRKQESLIWDGSPVQVTSAHFGLTIIDLKKLADVPRPWFWAQPNAEGDWSGNKIDDDVYFWRQWERAGHSLFIDPGCRLGHMEEMITVFDEDMTIKHIYPSQWSEQGASTVDQAVAAVAGG